MKCGAHLARTIICPRYWRGQRARSASTASYSACARSESPAHAEYEAVLADLARWQRQYRGQMMVRAKCAPHFMRHVHASDRDSPILNYETRCPCGTQYCRITPDGKLTPCPYLPEVAGD